MLSILLIYCAFVSMVSDFYDCSDKVGQVFFYEERIDVNFDAESSPCTSSKIFFIIVKLLEAPNTAGLHEVREG